MNKRIVIHEVPKSECLMSEISNAYLKNDVELLNDLHEKISICAEKAHEEVQNAFKKVAEAEDALKKAQDKCFLHTTQLQSIESAMDNLTKLKNVKCVIIDNDVTFGVKKS